MTDNVWLLAGTVGVAVVALTVGFGNADTWFARDTI
jgi:hypothetical protein